MGMILHVKGREMIGWQGPLPSKDDLIELHYPDDAADDETLFVMVTGVVHHTNGPYDSHSTRVVLTSIHAEPV